MTLEEQVEFWQEMAADYRRQMELAESRLAAALIVLFLLLLAEATEGNHLPRLHRYSRGLQRD